MVKMDAETLKNLGNTHLSQGRLDEAEEAYRRAIELDPNYGVAFNNLGNVLRIKGRLREAEQAFRSALALLPDIAEIRNNYGNVLLDLGRTAEAEESYRKAAVMKPEYAAAHYNRGNALQTLGRRQAAEKSYRRALDINPNYPEALVGLGQALVRMGRTEEALELYRKAIAIKPDFAEAHNDLGNALLSVGRAAEAEEAYKAALAVKPAFATAELSLSMLYLMQGRLREGFALYERRFEGGYASSFRSINELLKGLPGRLRWRGEALEGKSLLVITEQGAGDSLMMMRYLPLLKERGAARVVAYCEPHLKRLMRTVAGVDEVIPKSEPLPVAGIDFFCTLMSLPHLFQTELATIPGAVPYIAPSEDEVGKWSSLLGCAPGLKVGLVWAGNNLYPYNDLRRIPLRKFLPLKEIAGVRLISLQKGEFADTANEFGWASADPMERCDDYLDTAALVSRLDLVISVCTSVAHLAGALGKPVWLLNRFESEWRWMLGREDSPWYPTMRIFRQQSSGNWDEVIDRVAAELRRFADRRHSEQN